MTVLAQLHIRELAAAYAEMQRFVLEYPSSRAADAIFAIDDGIEAFCGALRDADFTAPNDDAVVVLQAAMWWYFRRGNPSVTPLPPKNV